MNRDDSSGPQLGPLAAEADACHCFCPDFSTVRTHLLTQLGMNTIIFMKTLFTLEDGIWGPKMRSSTENSKSQKWDNAEFHEIQSCLLS